MVSPVAGFRPSRAFLSDLTSFPKPGSTNSPLDLTSRGREVIEFVKELLYLSALHSRLLRKVIKYFRLRHALLACRGFGRHSLVDTSDET